MKKVDSDNEEANIWDTGVEFYEIAERDRKVVENFVDAAIADQK